MASLVESLSQFLVFIGVGVVLFLPVVSLKETGVGFGKLILSVSFFSIIAFSLLLVFSPLAIEKNAMPGKFIALLCCIGVSYFSLSRNDHVTIIPKICYGLFSLFSILLLSDYLSVFSIESVFLLFGALFVGCSTFAMLLGHYYLVVPKLSERPLIILHYLLWGIMGAKVLISGYSYLSIEMGQADLWDKVYISMRALWGYLAIAILSYFSYRLSKMRSTQSATGVLYVIVFFMIVGELVSYYLYNSKGFLV